MEVKPASGLVPRQQSRLGAEASKKLKRTIPQEPKTIGHEQSELTPTSASELTPSFTPHLTPSFNSHHFTTELCVDLKTILTSDRKAKRFKDYRGVLTRDGREHFTFLEDAQERKIVRRYPCIYKGFCLNVHRRDDGLLYLNFRQPRYTRFYTFRDFCREAAEELLMVVGLVEENE